MAMKNFLRNDYFNYINSNMDLLFELSNNGNPSAQYVLGVLLLRENPINKENYKTKQINTAIRFLEKSAKTQNIDAILELIYVYKNMLSFITDKKEKDIYNNKILELNDLLKMQVTFINKQLENIENGLDPFSTRFPKPTKKENIHFVENPKNLEEFTQQLNYICRSKQDDDKEIISDELMYECKEIVDGLTPKTVNDVLLYCSSLNLLNTYVKQKQNKLSYYFKNNVMDILVMSIIKNEIKDVTYNITYDRGMTICYVKVFDLIFSFHQVTIHDNVKDQIINSKFNQKILFDGIRKQKLAATIYYNVAYYISK